MHHVLVVRRRQSFRHLRRVLHRPPLCQRPFFHLVTQGFPVEQFADHVGRALVFADVIHRQDVGRIQRCYRPRLLLEAPQPVGIAGK